MTRLTQQRCRHHSGREAVARCPACGEHFCRECITEHDDRVICAACLQRLVAPTAKRPARLRLLRSLLLAALGVLTAWICFYAAGRILLTIPSSFHDGSAWQNGEATE